MRDAVTTRACTPELIEIDEKSLVEAQEKKRKRERPGINAPFYQKKLIFFRLPKVNKCKCFHFHSHSALGFM